MNTAKYNRWLLLLSAVLMIGSLYLPWWNLLLIAPQYPEGLNITVFPSRLEGQLDIINILNHYIGMAHISEEGFPELTYIPMIMWGLVLILIINALTASKKLTHVIFGMLVLGGMLGIYDMYHWLQTFGSNLDPQAPIKVPPFIPPMIGENTLANFITYSQFQLGFFLVLAGGIFVFLAAWGDKLWTRKR